MRDANDMIHWIKFFLNAVITTSEKGKNTFMGILKLKEQIENRIVNFGRKMRNARKLLLFLYSKPIVTAGDVEEFLKLSRRSARDLINELMKNRILTEITGYKRNRVFSFKEYLDLF